jgi:WD40 repeat protein
MVNSISLSADGTRLASISVSGKIRLFDVDSRTQLHEYKQEHMTLAPQDGLVALSPNGNFIAAAQHGNDGTLKVWNADNGALIFEQKHVRAPVGFSPDSQSLAATTKAGLRIWNTADWTSRSLGDSLVTGFSPSLAFTPDSSRVVFSPRHNASKLMIYNLADNTTEGELAAISAVDAISTDGSIVVAGGWGGKVCVWDLASGSVIKKFQAHIHLAVEVWDLKFSSDGRILASAGKDDSVKLWDLTAQPKTESEYSVPRNLSCRGFSQSGDVLRFQDPNEWPNIWDLDFEAPKSRTDHLLDLSTGQWTHVRRSDSEALAQTKSMMWETDQDTYLFGKADGTVVLSDGTTTQSIQVTDHPVEPLLLSPKRRYLLLNVLPKNTESYAILWDLDIEEINGQYPKTRRAAISPDERFLAYYSDNDFAVKLWQIPEKRQWATLRGHKWYPCGVDFSPDSRLLASFSLDGSCRLWNVEKGEKANPHLFQGHRSGVQQVFFSPDGRTLATASKESFTIKLWSVATGQEMLSLPAAREWYLLPMMAAKADRLVWGGDSGKPQGTTPDAGYRVLRVTTLPSLVEIDEEIRRQSSAEVLRASEDGQE